MKVNFSSPKQVTIWILILLLALPLYAAVDQFDRANGALGGNWAAHSDMVILNQRLHNQGATSGWDSYLAVYNVADANEATIYWPTDGNGISGAGAQLGGIAFVNSFSAGADGYLVYIYSNELRLFEISNGSPVGDNIQPGISTASNPGPDDDFTVKFNTTTYTFTVLINGTEVGSIQDPSKKVSFAARYPGLMLYKSDTNENDVEAFSAEYVAPSSDVTAPAQIADLAASNPTSSSVALTWTAVGDDNNSGTASLYDVRYSKNNITSDDDFNNATAATGMPAPKQAGQTENVTVSGLDGSSTYYFAVKARDEAGNWSPLSNIASETTTEGGGGGGGGTIGGELAWVTDDFERLDLGADWDATNHVIADGEMTLLSKENGWSNLAIFQRLGAYGAAMTFSAENSELYNGYITAGLLILMDNQSPLSASGYMVRRSDDELSVFRVSGGSVTTSVAAKTSVLNQSAPQPGDNVRVEITDNGSTKTLTYYVRGAKDATVDISDASSVENTFVGVALYGGDGFLNNLEDFSAGFPGAGAQTLVKVSGDLQEGNIEEQLLEPIVIQVLDGNSQPYQGELIDFELVNGSATLDDLNFDFQGQVWVEVEDGRFTSDHPYLASDDGASGGQYVAYQEISPARGIRVLEVPFYIPEDGNYDFYVRYRVQAQHSSTDNFYFGVDGVDSTLADVQSRTTWFWDKVGNFSLLAGQHETHFALYEWGFEWDKILIQKSTLPDYSGNTGVGGTGPEFPNITDMNGEVSTHVTFGTSTDTVIIYARGQKSTGDPLEDSPAVFTLFPKARPGSQTSMDYASASAFPGTPGLDSQPMKVKVMDPYGNGVPDVTVNWRNVQGEGTLQSGNSITDVNGIAENILTLNFYQETDYIVEAYITGLTGSPKQFTITPGAPPTEIVQVQPLTRQEGNVNTTIDSLLVVRIMVDSETPFEGYPVVFAVTQGDGTLSSQNGAENVAELEVPTDVQGYARAVWTLGAPGLNVVEARAENLSGNPVEFEAWAQTGQAANFAKLSGDEQSGFVGMPLAQPFVIKLTDANGYPVAEEQIDFEIINGQGAYFDQSGVTSKSAYTDNLGEARVTLTLGSILNEQHTVKASAINTALSPLYFTATPTDRIAKTLSYISGNGSGGVYQKAVVTNTLANPFIVKAVGPYGNPAEGQPVTFRVINGGGDFGGLTEKTVNTDAQGLAQVTLTLGTLAGDSVHIVHAVAKRQDVPDVNLEGSPIVFKAGGLAKPAAKLFKIDSTDAQTGEVGLPLANHIRVRVTDEYQNPIKNHAVKFKVQGQGGELEDGSGKGTTKIASTNSDGFAAMIWHMPDTPGIVYVDVTATDSQGQPLDGSPAQFTANAKTGPPHTMLRITPDSILVGRVWQPLEQKLKVKITDRLGNPLVGKPVTFKVIAGDGLLNGLPQVTINTADSGFAVAEWRLGKTSGIAVNKVEAIASVEVNALITFEATGLADEAFRLVPDSSYTTYGLVGALLPDPIKVKIVDQYGNGVKNQLVDFEIVPVDTNVGYINQKGQTTASETTDDNGFVQVRWGLGPVVGSQNNRMRTSAMVNQVHLVNSPYTFSASATVGGASKIVKITDDSDLSSIIGNTLSEYLKVRITDNYDNPIARFPVRFEVLSRKAAEGGSLDGLVDSVKVKETDSNGFAWVQFTLGQKAGFKINQIQAIAENAETGEHLDGSPVLFEVTGTSTNARKIELVDGEDQIGVVGKHLPRDVQVVAVDQYDNPVKGQPIRFRIVPDDSLPTAGIGALGQGAAVDTSVNTDDKGIAAIKWRMGQLAGTYQLEATSFGDGHLQNSPLMISAEAIADRTDPDTSFVVVTPSQVVVSNGENRATVIVTLRDQYANPVSGKAVSIVVTGEGNLITQPTDTTNSNGQAFGYIASRGAGVKYVTARDLNNGVSLRDSAASVLFKPAAAAKILKAPGDNGDTQSRNIGTVLEKPFKVLVTDQFSNPIKDVAVTFHMVTGGGVLVTNQPTYTDSLGIGQSYYRLGLQAGANLVEARSSGLAGSPVNFSAIAENPAQITQMQIISGNNLSNGPGQDVPEALRVRILDNRQWPVAAKDVKYEVLVNNGVIVSQNPVASDMYGEAAASAKLGTTIGLNIFKASLVELPHVSATFYDTTSVIPGSGATTILEYAGNNQQSYVGQTLPAPLTVKVTDPYGNPVPGVTVTFTVVEDQTVEGIGTLEGGVLGLAKSTNQFGLASAYYTLGEKAGLNMVRASGNNLEPAFIEFSVYGNASTAYSMRKWDGDEQTGEMDRVLLKPISVRIFDRHGNPARGGRVNFVVLQGGGAIVEPQPVLSGPDGIASVHWKLGPRPSAYTNVAQAVADGLPGGTYVETFNATGDPSHWPRLQLPGELMVNEDQIISFNVFATDSDNPPIFCEAEKLPDSTATFVDNGDDTWRFTWRPGFDVVQSPNQTRDIYAVFKATDMKGGKDIDSVKIVVRNVNRMPTVTRYWPNENLIKIEPGTVTKTEFGVDTFDPDGDIVTVTWFVDGAQVGYGHTWTMDYNLYPPYKYYSVYAQASDQESYTRQSWGVKVPVELVSFTTEITPYEGIHVKWETANQGSNLGFNILRSFKENGDYVKVNEELVEPSSNHYYDFVDNKIAAGRTYWYKLEDIGKDGEKSMHGPISAKAPVPTEFKLSQNYPNPFNPTTTIRFDLPEPALVKLEVYNVLGQRVRTLLDKKMNPGFHAVMWDGANEQGLRVSSGVYYYRISAGDFSSYKKMALLK